MTEERATPSAWDTETGLPNDVDAYIKNAHFGEKDEYKQAVAASGSEGGLMFLFDLLSPDGEILGSQGYSIGSGWIPSDDGMSISHPKRRNVVGSSLYGQLQNRVVKELKVDMIPRGMPTEAKSWEGLGFHWMMQPHMTVGGKEATGLMPVEFIGELGGAAATPTAPPAAAKPVVQAGSVEAKLTTMAGILDMEAFQKAALVVPGVSADDKLMAAVLDEGKDGFWATHHTG